MAGDKESSAISDVMIKSLLNLLFTIAYIMIATRKINPKAGRTNCDKNHPLIFAFLLIEKGIKGLRWSTAWL